MPDFVLHFAREELIAISDSCKIRACRIRESLLNVNVEEMLYEAAIDKLWLKILEKVIDKRESKIE